MPTIDADAHVIESEHTWDFIDESDSKFRPQLDPLGKYWIIDNNKFSRGTSNKALPEASRDMRDVGIRLRHMDELEIDIQVLYPSLFLKPLTRRPEVELAICKSYNRWMAEVWSKSENRLRWAAVVPLMSMDDAVAEARFAKDNGGCAIFTRGIVGKKLLSDPYFYPLYQEASKLDMPVCVHAAEGNFDWVELFEKEGGFSKFKLSALSAFHSIVHDGIPQIFPKLRFGFIEVRAQWVPYVYHELARRFEKLAAKRSGQRERDTTREFMRDDQLVRPFTRNFMREDRLYVACQTDDDLPYILKYSGEDNIVIGTDYGHEDTSSEIEALRKLKSNGEVRPEVIDKILYANPKALYNF